MREKARFVVGLMFLELCAGCSHSRESAPKSTPAPPVSARWPFTIGRLPTDAVAVSTDVSGNVYVVGRFYNSLLACGQVHAAQGLGDAFLMKLAPDGVCLWVETVGTKDGDDVATAVIAVADHVYWGGTLGYGTGLDRLFLARADARTGRSEWQLNTDNLDRPGAGAVQLRSMAVTSDGLVAGGFFAGKIRIGTRQLTSSGVQAGGFERNDGLLIDVRPEGTVRWVSQIGGADADAVEGVMVRSDHELTVVGNTRSPGICGRSSSARQVEAFIADVSATGAVTSCALLRAHPASDVSAYATVTAAAALPDRALAVAGVYWGSLDLGGIVLRNVRENDPSSVPDSFVATLDPSGVRWAHRSTEPGSRVSSLAASTTMLIAAGTSGTNRGIVRAYSAAGDPIWMATMATTAQAAFRGVTITSCGSAVLVGTANGGDPTWNGEPLHVPSNSTFLTVLSPMGGAEVATCR